MVQGISVDPMPSMATTPVRYARKEPAKPPTRLCPHQHYGQTLARSTYDLFAMVRQIVDAKAQFRSLAESGLTGTRTFAQERQPQIASCL
jgi:hypothetical protein